MKRWSGENIQSSLLETCNTAIFIALVAVINSICGQYCFVLCGLISAAQSNEAEPDSNEE